MILCNSVHVSIVLFFGYIGYCRPDGDCSRTVSEVSHSGVIYFKKHYCCDNYEMTKDGCQGCRKGFTSKANSDCKPCHENTYGNKCAETCMCGQGERCDNVNGCLKVEKGITMDSYTSLRTERMIQKSTFTSTWKDTTILIPTDLYQGHLSVIFTRASKESADSKTVSGPGNVIIYTAGIGGGCILMIIVFTTFAIFCCKQYATDKLLINSHELTTHQSPSDTINDDTQENEYDEINEENINVDPMRQQDARDHSFIENVCGSDNDGYLKHDQLFIYLNEISEIGGCKYKNQTKHQKEKSNNCLQISKSYSKTVGMADNTYLEIINDEDDVIEIPSNYDN